VDDKISRQPSVLLRPLRVSDEEQALQAHEELAQDDFEFLLGLEQGASWPAYCGWLESQRLGVDEPAGWVPSTFLVAEAEGQIVGRVSIRHVLNDHLAEVGGHIGYGVRPGFRRRGYATAILGQSLAVASSMGLDRVLVTCDDDNEGSVNVIQNCDGVLEDVVAGRDGSVAKRRYWVEIGA
jgi:predicted acetyltransferase